MEVTCHKGQLLMMGAPSCKNHPHKFLASRTQYWDHKTAINFSRLESFAIFIALFCSFHSWVTCSVKMRRAMMCDRSNAARKSSLCCCDRTSLIRWLRQCQKSGQKADYIQCRARLASFGAGKIAKNRGKIVAAWQYHLLDTYLFQRT